MAVPAGMMISPIGMTKSDLSKRGGLAKRNAFTLVELILVMALLALVMGFAAPSLSRSMRARRLAQEAVRFIALTEFARDEAVSRGVPMTVWIDTAAGRFGLAPKTGFIAPGMRLREFALEAPAQMEIAAGGGAAVVTAVEFSPDGTPEPAAIERVRFTAPSEEGIAVVKAGDGWAYTIEKESE
jgi:prepilin-type N-terminal cleavage/methylation domain-containing protein